MGGISHVGARVREPGVLGIAAAGAGHAGDLSALLGQVAEAAVGVAAPEAPPANNRFTLVGVAAAKGAAGSREGLALIGVDDKPPRAFRVGAVVEGEWVLQSVSARGAQLGPRGGAAAVVLELPPLPPPATGVLGAEGGGPAPPGHPARGHPAARGPHALSGRAQRRNSRYTGLAVSSTHG
jgi:general secretion pathway protein C